MSTKIETLIETEGIINYNVIIDKTRPHSILLNREELLYAINSIITMGIDDNKIEIATDVENGKLNLKLNTETSGSQYTMDVEFRDGEDFALAFLPKRLIKILSNYDSEDVFISYSGRNPNGTWHPFKISDEVAGINTAGYIAGFEENSRMEN